MRETYMYCMYLYMTLFFILARLTVTLTSNCFTVDNSVLGHMTFPGMCRKWPDWLIDHLQYTCKKGYVYKLMSFVLVMFYLSC